MKLLGLWGPPFRLHVAINWNTLDLLLTCWLLLQWFIITSCLNCSLLVIWLPQLKHCLCQDGVVYSRIARWNTLAILNVNQSLFTGENLGVFWERVKFSWIERACSWWVEVDSFRWSIGAPRFGFCSELASGGVCLSSKAAKKSRGAKLKWASGNTLFGMWVAFPWSHQDVREVLQKQHLSR